MQTRCACKINVYLKILGKRIDGYHELSTLFWPMPEPFDVLEMEIRADSTCANISVICDTEGIDVKSNTLTKAYELYAERTGYSPALQVKLQKGIPHGAGLGGGSSDAAIILKFLQEKNSHPLSEGELVELAAKVGADVPFFLNPQPCIAEGIGEKIRTYEKVNNKFYSVLICPGIRISTSWAFKFLDTVRKDLTETSSIAKNHCSSFPQEFFLGNDFEPLVFAEYPIISQIQERFVELGAFVSCLSGTGSSVFGFFDEKRKAEYAVKNFKEFLAQKDSQIYGPFGMEY